MSKKSAKKLKFNTQVSPWWAAGAVLLVGLFVWKSSGGMMKPAPAGINEIALVPSQNILATWEFDGVSAEGWIVKKQIGAKSITPASIGTLPSPNPGGTTVPTTLADGMLVIPGSVGKTVYLMGPKNSFILPESTGNLTVRVVVSAVVPPMPSASPIVLQGQQIPNVNAPSTILTGMLKFGNGQGEAALETKAKPQISGSDLVYDFKIPKDRFLNLATGSAARSVVLKEMQIYLSYAGTSLSEVKIDSITVQSDVVQTGSGGRPSSSPTPADEDGSGTARGSRALPSIPPKFQRNYNN